jgi:hypothetical protein
VHWQEEEVTLIFEKKSEQKYPYPSLNLADDGIYVI